MSRRPINTRLPIAALLLGAALGASGCGRSQARNTEGSATVAMTSSATGAPAMTNAAAPMDTPQPPAQRPPDPCPSIGTLAEAKGPINLNGARLVRLNTVCPARSMTEHLRAFGDGVRFILVADDLRAGVQPGALFELSLGPPSTGEAAVIGTINFFGAQRPSGLGQPHSISFDVTRQVQGLAVSGWPEQGLGVAVAPSGPVAPGADATVGALRLVAEAPR